MPLPPASAACRLAAFMPAPSGLGPPTSSCRRCSDKPLPTSPGPRSNSTTCRWSRWRSPRCWHRRRSLQRQQRCLQWPEPPSGDRADPGQPSGQCRATDHLAGEPDARHGAPRALAGSGRLDFDGQTKRPVVPPPCRANHGTRPVECFGHGCHWANHRFLDESLQGYAPSATTPSNYCHTGHKSATKA